MKIYPALKGHIGEKKPLYYVVMMKVKDLVAEVRLAHEILTPKSISDNLQRELDEKRTKDIIKFFEREDRFISSIVVATIGGDPEFHEVEVKDNPILSFGGLNEYFGALTFDGREKYYVLDGQHRLFALRKAAEKGTGVENDRVSVILIPGGEEMELSENTKIRYRKLFTWMNRYAKPTNKGTNIAMDEEDLYAIVTRRLIENHPLFSATSRVDIHKKTVKPNSSYFTSIETLYQFTLICLKHSGVEIPEYADRSRPSSRTIENCVTFSVNIWDSLLQLFDFLIEEPSSMRNQGEDGPNHLFFRPIGQRLLATLISRLIFTDYQSADHNTTIDEFKEILAPLSLIDWELKHRPWLHLLVTEGEDSQGNKVYRMRREKLDLPELMSWFMLARKLTPEQEKSMLWSIEKRWRSDISDFFPDEQSLLKEWSAVKNTLIKTRKKIKMHRGEE